MESGPVESPLQEIPDLPQHGNGEIGQGEGQPGETGPTGETDQAGESGQKGETDQTADINRVAGTNDPVEPAITQAGGGVAGLSPEPEKMDVIVTEEPQEQAPGETQEVGVIEGLGKVSTHESVLVEDIVGEELLWVLIENHGNDILIFINERECSLSKEVLSILQDHAESRLEIEVVDVSEIITFAPDFPEALKEFTANDCPLVFYKKKYVGNHSEIVKANLFKRVDLILEPPTCPCYHIVIIGTGPGALSVLAELEKSNKSFKIALIDWTPLIPYNEGRVIGIGPQGNLPRHLLWNAIRNIQASQEASHLLRDEDLSGYSLSETWDDATYMCSGIEHINWDFRKRLASIKIDFYRGSIEFIGPDTITVTYGIDSLESSESSSSSSSTTSTSSYNPSDEDYSGPRSTDIVGMNFIICGGSVPRILEFPGFEHCVTIENFLYDEELPPTALIIGNTPEVFETAYLIASYGGEVTVMNKCSQWLAKYDQESIDKIMQSLIDLGVRFFKISRIMYIKETDLGYKVKVKLENNKSYRNYFYTVIMDYTRLPLSSQINIEKAGVTLGRLSRKIVVTGEFRTTNESVWAFGSVARKHLGSPQFEILAGRRVINFILKGIDDTPIPTIFPGVLLTPLEYGFVGETEKSARIKYTSEITIYESESHLAPYTETRVIKNPFQIKIICIDNWHCLHREKVERVVGIHLLGKNASRLITGFASSLEKGLTKRDFLEMLSIKASADMGLFRTQLKLKDTSEKTIISLSTESPRKNEFLRHHVPYRCGKEHPFTLPGLNEVEGEISQADANQPINVLSVTDVWTAELAEASVNDNVNPDEISLNLSDTSDGSLECDPLDRDPSTSFSSASEPCQSLTSEESYSVICSSMKKPVERPDDVNQLDKCSRKVPDTSSSNTDSFVFSLCWWLVPFVLSFAAEYSNNSVDVLHLLEPNSDESIVYPGLREAIQNRVPDFLDLEDSSSENGEDSSCQE